MTLQVVPDIMDEATEINQQAVEDLERALEMAKSGELIEVIVVGVLQDGGNYSSCTSTRDVPRQIGLLEIVKQRRLRSYLPVDE